MKGAVSVAKILVTSTEKHKCIKTHRPHKPWNGEPARRRLLKKPGDIFIPFLITTESFLGATHATCIKEYSHLHYDFSYLI